MLNLKFFCCGISEAQIRQITEKYGFKAGKLLVKYLGVPMIIRS